MCSQLERLKSNTKDLSVECIVCSECSLKVVLELAHYNNKTYPVRDRGRYASLVQSSDRFPWGGGDPPEQPTSFWRDSPSSEDSQLNTKAGNMFLTSPLLLLLVTTSVFAADDGGIDWRTEPTWGFQSNIGSDIQLECNDTNVNVMSGDNVTWTTPMGVDMAGSNDRLELLKKNYVDGLILKIVNVTESDRGVYICVITRSDMPHGRLLRALNLYEPSYENMMDKYRHNVIVALIAAAIFFFPFVGLCCLSKFQFKTEEYKEKMRTFRDHAQRVNDDFLNHQGESSNGVLQQRKVSLDNDAYVTEPDYSKDSYAVDTTRL